jgi:hypothetical protein
MSNDYATTNDALGGVGSNGLFGILGEAAPARRLTAYKTDFILRRDGSQITGFVVTDKYGGIGIIDKSAVRWLTGKEMWWLMHDSAQIGIDLMPNTGVSGPCPPSLGSENKNQLSGG